MLRIVPAVLSLSTMMLYAQPKPGNSGGGSHGKAIGELKCEKIAIS